MITQPIGLRLHEWADRVVQDVNTIATIGKLTDDDWQSWAAQFLLNNVGRNLPDPYGFADWQEWAQRLCGVI